MTTVPFDKGWLLPESDEPVHDDEYPILLSERTYVGGYTIATGFVGGNAMNEARAKVAFAWREPGGFLRQFGDYKIHYGGYSLDEAEHLRLVETHGHATVVELEEHRVAALLPGIMWVHPEHTGHNLGAEMIFTAFVKHGVEGFLAPDPEPRFVRQYTPDGLKSWRESYRLLIERGVVVSPEEP